MDMKLSKVLSWLNLSLHEKGARSNPMRMELHEMCAKCNVTGMKHNPHELIQSKTCVELFTKQHI